MRIVLITVVAVGLFGTTPWAGDPVGTYSVSGSNPGGSSYSGTATVEKTGATYKVTWVVAGTHFEGHRPRRFAVSRRELPDGRRHRPRALLPGGRRLGGGVDLRGRHCGRQGKWTRR